jgi:hypothetical protein
VNLAKPPFGAPCNGCGLCCRMQVCGIGQVAFPDAVAPCPALRFDGRRYRCSLVEMETDQGVPPVLANALGIGRGCCSDDDLALAERGEG